MIPMSLKDIILNFLLDTLRVPTDILKSLVDKADTDRDGFVSMRELYDIYRRYRNG